MKLPYLLITLLAIAFQFARAADQPKFFAARGQYALAPKTTLTISDDERDHLPQYTLTTTVQQANTPTTVSHGGTLTGAKPGEPFLIYWDADSQTLWWATSQRLGYCDIRNPQSAKSAAHDRAKPFHDSFSARPEPFRIELERSLRIQP